MFQHPSATRSIASLSVGRYRCPTGRAPSRPVHLPLPPPTPHTRATPAPCTADRPLPHFLPPSPSCFLPPTLRVTSVADRPQPPFAPIANPRFPRSTSAVAAALLSMTSRDALLFASLNSYIAVAGYYICVCVCVCMYICI